MNNARCQSRSDRRAQWKFLAATFVLLLPGMHPPASAQGAPVTARSYLVVASGLTDQQAAALGNALGVPVDGRIAGGAYQYVDPDRFLALPTVPVPPLAGSDANEDGEPVTSEGIDFKAVKMLAPPSKKAALSQVNRALAAAGIALAGGTPQVASTFFDTFTTAGKRLLHQAIATNVSFGFVTPDGLPLEGPGAKAEFSFDTTGRASLVWLSTRQLAPGPDVPILSHDEALIRCAAGAPAGATVTADLVYYAGGLALGVQAIVPHYRCGGSATSASGGVTQMKIHYIPATVPGSPLGPPVAAVSASATGSLVCAQADAIGGTPPYTFAWSSANTPLSPAPNNGTICYDVTSRDPSTASDTINVTITDGNGLASQANAVVAVSNVGAQPLPTSDPSSRTVGIEYQSWSAGLWGSYYCAGNLVAACVQAVPTVVPKFVEADLMSWETDFRTEIVPGGRDNLFVDNVDLAYYNSHGAPGAISFTSQHDYDSISALQWLNLGDRDLEWLALDTCLFLNNDDGKVMFRIQAMFRGIHSVLGFDTTAEDTSELGGIFPDYLFGLSLNPYSHSLGARLTVVQAWALAVIITNHSDKVWAAQGPFGAMGISDVGDHFWGFGTVGPDIRGSNVKGFWRLSGPA